ncbi:hypothetical protein P0W64_13595 [Tsukamurella sp. 8F]|nr:MULTISPECIES: hypothetical protein [unclassified Tsukamurella]MDF0530605.1 hypothetical protein [Tsukamurella sp. 8J]MDF0587806.1 hypothetical protein [Tsukamurella sp. 8F]
MKLTAPGRTDHRTANLPLTRLRTRKLVRTLAEDSERLVTPAEIRALRT